MCIPVLSKVKTAGSPKGPSMEGGWMVRVTFGWSIYDVVRNDDKTPKSYRNSLVTKQNTLGAIMGCPFHSWVTFGNWVTLFAQHWCVMPCLCWFQFESMDERQLKMIFDGQTAIHQTMRELHRKLDEVVGRQERTMSQISLMGTGSVQPSGTGSAGVSWMNWCSEFI